MYSSTETELSRSYLKGLLSSLPQPHCLIGGWSVYLVVNDAFERATGREYLGSRDIDLGFHFDPKWEQEEFENSPFGRALVKIREMGFQAESFRFVKRFHASDGRELTEEESRHLQLYEIFNLYIDVLVDSVDPKRFEKAKFSVLEEPLLSRVFSGKEYRTARLRGLEVMIPDPQLQMEMKVRSFPGRTQDDKKTKDLLDLCALLLYSGNKPPVMEEDTEGRMVRSRYKLALKSINEEEWNTISSALDVTVREAKRVAGLIR